MEEIVVKIEPDLLLEHLGNGVTDDLTPLAEFEENMDTFPNLPPPPDLENGAPANTLESSSEFKIFKTPKKEVKEIPDHDSESNCVEIKEEIEEKYTPDPVLFCESVLSSTNSQKAANVFKCSECAMEFPKNINLQKHMRAAHQNKVQCSLCQKSYVDKARLHRHKLRVHNINDEETEKSNSKMPAAAKVAVTPEKLKCFKCDQTFTTAFRLQNHEYSAHPIKKEFKCSACDLKFSSENIQMLHEKFTHPAKTVIKTESIKDELPEEIDNNPILFSCPKCSKKFEFISDLKFHQKLYCDTYTCSICAVSFRSSIGLHNHNRTHMDPYPRKLKSTIANFKCSKCDQTLKSIRYLSIHNKHHGDKYPCQLCPGVFSNKNYVLLHRQNTHPECEEKYNYKPTPTPRGPRGEFIKWSKSSSAAEKGGFKCANCPDIFGTMKEAIEHEKSHGEQWPCKFCDAVFETSHGMKIHSGTAHSEQNQFKCFKCPLDFPTHWARNKHIKKHRKLERRIRYVYKCWKCGLRFPTLLEKARHEEEVCRKKKVEIFYCHLCLKAYKTKQWFISHKKNVHEKAGNQQEIHSGGFDFSPFSEDVKTSEMILKSIIIQPEEVFVTPDEVKKEVMWDQSELEDPILGI